MKRGATAKKILPTSAGTGKSSNKKALKKRNWRVSAKELDRIANSTQRAVPALLVNGTMLNSTEASTIAEEVGKAFQLLAAEHTELVVQFERVFASRSALPGVPESAQDAVGLSKLLAQLLPIRFEVPKKPAKPGKDREPRITSDFLQALKLLIEREPISLLLLRQNQIRKGCTLEEALAGIFMDYISREHTLPY